MAKKEKNTGGSKIRFIMLDADIADGDFAQITAAITNALKPQHVRTVSIGSGNVSSRGGHADIDTELEPEVDEIIEEEEVEAAPTKRRSNTRSRKPVALSIIKDLSLRPKDKPSLRDFVSFPCFRADHN